MNMMAHNRSSRYRLLIGINLFLWLMACQTAPAVSTPPTATADALPTLARIAAVETTTVVPAPSMTPTPASDESIPPTWTPAPAEQTISAGPYIDPNQTRLPTFTPTPRSTLPPRTPTPTNTPLPTFTPTPYQVTIPTLEPSTDLGPSKLGLHVIRNNDPNIMEFVRRAQPPVIKAVGDLGFLSEVKEASPGTVTIGRVDDFRAQNYVGDPREEAAAYVEKHLETYFANPGVDYWEGWNEPDPNINNMPWYAAYEAERVRLMAFYGLRAAVGGFATGVPELREFELFLPAIRAVKEYGGILTLHEYSAPNMLYLYGGALPGQPSYADRGALTFRYRWFYEEILKPRDLVVPLAITEAGVDGIIGNRPGPDGRGWRDFGSYWVQQGIGPTADQAYINQLAWYDNGVRQDGYVIGFTVFSAGGIAEWKSYDINSILPELAAYAEGQRNR